MTPPVRAHTSLRAKSVAIGSEAGQLLKMKRWTKKPTCSASWKIDHAKSAMKVAKLIGANPDARANWCGHVFCSAAQDRIGLAAFRQHMMSDK